MAFLPLNIFGVLLFLFGVVWGWEGETLRRLFAMISSTFLYPMWYLPLFSIVDDTACCTIVAVKGWLPTLFFQVFIYFSLAISLAAYAHIVEGEERDLMFRSGRTLLGRKRL